MAVALSLLLCCLLCCAGACWAYFLYTYRDELPFYAVLLGDRLRPPSPDVRDRKTGRRGAFVELDELEEGVHCTNTRSRLEAGGEAAEEEAHESSSGYDTYNEEESASSTSSRPGEEGSLRSCEEDSYLTREDTEKEMLSDEA